MGLLDRLRGLLAGSDHERRTYECEDCGTTFDAAAEERGNPDCPDCGAGAATAVPSAG